jgi:DNA-binding IclR family transcriptional regulator
MVERVRRLPAAFPAYPASVNPRAAEPETSQTLDRGLRALEELAEASGGLTVAELAVRVGAPRTAAYRLVATLEAHGYARRTSDGRVRLGLGVLGLARRVHPLLRDAAIPTLRRLAEDLGATAHLTVAEGPEGLAVAVVEPSWTDFHVAYRVGSRHPLAQGAAGKAILLGRGAASRAGGTGTGTGTGTGLEFGGAGAGPEVGGDIQRGSAAPTFAASESELQPGAHGLAAPILDVVGLEASVGVVAFASFDAVKAAPRVVRAAAEIAARLR